jgi:hypothetical protein
MKDVLGRDSGMAALQRKRRMGIDVERGSCNFFAHPGIYQSFGRIGATTDC